jgi:hypothetical protein
MSNLPKNPVRRPGQCNKHLVDPAIRRQLRMKRRSQNSLLTHQNRVVAVSAEHGDLGIHTNDSWSAYEHALHLKRLAQLVCERDLSNRRVRLSSIGVSNDIDTQNTETLLRRLDVFRKQYHPGTCSENRHSRRYSIPNSASKILGLHQPQHGRGLATGNHQGIDLCKIGSGSYRPSRRAKVAKYRPVSRPVSLESKNPVLRHELTILDAKASPRV